ncbi:alpha/beta hydrolase [Emcibacter nanhaiensis]|uniref:Alpha/beta hydrolase n=1 Tax=Emcibacter nanhaiensis TaxID=1505037 RepID=A0A501PUP1_9PROT|nr:alpha/beta hydrolase [Emcibacter nanhaiensis]TPD63807.1 alpha/beta hydrolase [Emcibacter nanhaiensis]
MSVEKDVVYHSVNGRDLKVDLYKPEGGSVPTKTAVVLIHGGGWILGEKGMMTPLASQFAAQGFLAVAVEYRLVREAAWPAQLEDVTTAVRWVADNATDLGIDADRIVVAGASAGGHLALMAAAELNKESKVAAVLSLFSASELTVSEVPEKGKFNAAMLLGSDASDDVVKAASPYYQVSEGFPPTFVLHGTKDWLIDPVASLRLYEKLNDLGVTAELHMVANAIHEFIEEPGMTGPMVSEIALFLNRVVIDPAKWAAETEEHNLFAKGPEALQALMAQMLEQTQ